MKKKWLVTSLVILCFLLFPYLFIPNKIKVSKVAYIHCLADPAGRFLLKGSEWLKWLNYSQLEIIHEPAFKILYKDYNFIFLNQYKSSAPIKIIRNKLTLNSNLNLIPLTGDSSIIQWTASLKSSYNPAKRISQYFQVTQVYKDFDEILKQAKSFLEKTENIYGFNIARGGFPDTLLMATRENYNHQPAMKEIYNAIHRLTNYIILRGIVPVNHPMFHIQIDDSIHFNLMVAVPINKKLDNLNDYFLIRMQHAEGKFVTTHVRGGPQLINIAHKQIESYMTDHNLTSPGVPFEILITDRSIQKDSSGWLTLICYPST